MWFYFALSFAITSSLVVVFAKKIMREVDEYTYLLVNSLFTVPFLLAISLTLFDFPLLDTAFWFATIIGTIISVFAGVLVYKAIRKSEISLVNAISAFNPVFTAFFSFVALGEKISQKELVGISLVVIGAYILQLSKLKKGFFAPIMALVSHKGVQLSFLGYLLWAITPSFEKTAILHTVPQNPALAAFVGQIVAILIYTILVYKFSGEIKVGIKNNWKTFLLTGFLSGVGITLAFVTFSITSLGIATAVFKLSLIFIPLLGWILFREKGIKERLLGSVIMLFGVILLVT